MHYEIFEMKKRAVATDVSPSFAAQIQDAENVGATAQAGALIKMRDAASARARYETAPLKSEELTAWQAWLRNDITGDNVSQYATLLVPPEVLVHWRSCKELNLFDSFAVYTNTFRWAVADVPESLLVGIVGTDVYQLARWVQPGTDLKSYTDIKHVLWKQTIQGILFDPEFLLAPVIGSLIMGFIIAAIAHSLVVGILVTIAVGYLVGRAVRDRYLSNNKTAQALITQGCADQYGYLPF
jgi:hypothetical protein